MIMTLPSKFKMPAAEVVQDTLILYDINRFEDVMYELTYSLHTKECVYCGKKIKMTNRTIDHQYPRSYGGVSIVDNLSLSCFSCNSLKANLTVKEFKYCNEMEFTKKQRKNYLKQILKEREKVLKKVGFFLPKKWYFYEKMKNIICDEVEFVYYGRTYTKISEFYARYHKFPRPVIVDRENKLLDGYNIILVAKKRGLKRIPVIKLENVVLTNK